MKSKIESYLGFAARARKLVSGTNSSTFAMKKGKARLLIIATDTAENSQKKLCADAKRLGTEYRIYGHSDELSRITGTNGRSVFAVTDDNFARCILEEIDKEKEVFL